MGDLRTRLTLDGSDFTRGMDNAAKSVEDFTDASKMSASELLKQMKALDNNARSVSNYRQQLGQMQRMIADLTINYRQMTDEMKNSDFGRAVAAKIDELTTKAGEYKDAIMDAQMAVKNLASDTANWDAMKQGIEGVSAGLQAFVGLGVLGEQETKKLVAVLAKLKAIEAATNAVIKIGNMLQKDSAFMMGVSRVKALLLAKATTAEAAATTKAKIAMEGLNKAMAKNPILLLVTVMISAAFALAHFAEKADEAAKEQRELNEEVKKQKFEEYKTKISDAVGKVVGKFKALQLQWKQLREESEKKKWIDENASAFKELGLKVGDVNDAEKILVEQADDVIAALRAKAEAMALLDMYTESYKKQVEAEIQANKEYNDSMQQVLNNTTAFTANGQDFPDLWKAAGITPEDMNYRWGGGQSGAGFFDLNELGVAKWQLYVRTHESDLMKQSQATRDNIINEAKQDSDLIAGMWLQAEQTAEQAQAKIQGLTTNGNNNTNNNNKGGKTPKATETITEGSLKYWQKQVTDISDKLNNMDPNNPEFKTWVEALAIAQKKVLEIQNMMKAQDKPIQLIPPATGVTLKQAQEELAKIKKLMEETDPMSLSFFPLKASYELWTKKLEEIKKLMGEVKEENKEIVKINPYEALRSGIADINTLHTSFTGIYDNVKSIASAFKDCEDPLEAIFTTVDGIFGLLNNVITLAETLNKIEEISTAIQIAKNAAKKKETQEDMKQAILNATNLSTEQAEAIAATVKAAAEGGSSASKIPYVGWAIAIGAIAAIIAAISAAKSSIGFAYGGIVPGASFGGDHVAAQLNSGEMVLNTQQQRNLFSMLNNGASTTTGGEVKFTIEGQQLVGVLSNYNKKMNKI